MRTIALALAALVAVPARAQTAYQKPAKPILDVLAAPLPPDPFVSPTHDALILATPVRYPPIADLARPLLRLGGTRIDPGNNGLHGAPYFSDFVVVKLPGGAQTKVATPASAHLQPPLFSADGKWFAFTNITPTAVELWIGEVASAKVHRLGRVAVNPVLDDAVQWLPDQRSLLVKAVPAPRGRAPAIVGVPEGPKVEEATGEKVASSTYEARDLLRTPHDATLFEYYATAQLIHVDVVSGKTTLLGKPALYLDVTPSPDGKHLLVQSIHRPFSYVTTFARFPREVDVWSDQGKPEHKLASLPLFENVPIHGVPTGPRGFRWRSDRPAMVVWAEALDGGDWKTTVPHRDKLMMSAAPFSTPVAITELPQRADQIYFSDSGGQALVRERDENRDWTRTSIVQLDDAKAAPRVLWDHSTNEHYRNPGSPVLRTLPNGAEVLERDGDGIFTAGLGGSPAGDRPFLDRWDLRTLASERLFRSGTSGYESFLAWLDVRAGRLLTRAESPTEPPNYVVRTLGAATAKPEPGEAARTSTAQVITHMTDPLPGLRGIAKRIVRYQRADGVPLSFTLYLPPGYQEGTRLPTVVWAYPHDFADANVAGQVTGSSQRFTVIGWPLHLFFLLDGYAVIDNPSLPVVGNPKKIYDTYMEQLVAGAKAAVDKAVALGVTDPERIGITGHSHGGLMTANLLANSDLFRAGIARSGAYNHTLRPFGFQSERRTFWEAPEVYTRISPMLHADKIKAPLLIVHGEADFNPGTVPFQSELLFQAVRGTGGHARLVILPFESHRYSARESIEHALYEMLSWFDKYVKTAPPRLSAARAAAGHSAP
jgi:dipeptidyl aminopeptidase/acylaminoacyl peptidase